MRETRGDGGRAAFDRWTDDNDSYLYLRAFLHFDPQQMTDLSTDRQMLSSRGDTGDKWQSGRRGVGCRWRVKMEGIDGRRKVTQVELSWCWGDTYTHRLTIKNRNLSHRKNRWREMLFSVNCDSWQDEIDVVQPPNYWPQHVNMMLGTTKLLLHWSTRDKKPKVKQRQQACSPARPTVCNSCWFCMCP